MEEEEDEGEVDGQEVEGEQEEEDIFTELTEYR